MFTPKRASSDPKPVVTAEPASATSGVLTRTARGTSWLLRGGASLFVAFSVVSVAIAALTQLGDPSGSVALYDATIRSSSGDWVQSAWGLTYDGVPGLLLALGQLAVVVGAVVLSRRRSLLARLAGHGTLLAWATLWAANMLRLADVDHGFDAAGRAVAMLVFLGCAFYAAGRGVIVKPGRNAAPVVEDAPPLDDAGLEPALDAVPTLPLRADAADESAAPGRWRRGWSRGCRVGAACASGGKASCRAAWSVVPAVSRSSVRAACGVGRRVGEVARVAVKGVPAPAPVTEKA